MNFPMTLRHRIIVQEKPDETDGEGNPSNEWTEVCKLWADIRVSGGLERIRAGAVTSTVQASIRIRSRAGIDAGMRIVHGSSIYDIRSVPPADIGNVYMDLVCEVTK